MALPIYKSIGQHMKRLHSFIALCLCAITALGSSCGASINTPPQVVTSIMPFYALVASVMQGVGTPKLLVKPGASPHDYALRPSDMLILKDADIIFWGGPQLESFLIKPLDSHDLKKTLKIIEFDKIPGLLLLPIRHTAAFEPHDHSQDHAHDNSSDHAQNIDMHFWLDPNNALILVDTIEAQLSQADPIHAALYKENSKKFKKQLKTVDSKIKAQLKDIKNIPFIVFHDAYQYFEKQYDLDGVGSITLNPEVPPSAKRLTIIRDTIQKRNAQCVFKEPQFSPKLVHSIIEDTHIRMGQLDPLGTLPKNNENGYFKLLENLADSLKGCLKPSRS